MRLIFMRRLRSHPEESPVDRAARLTAQATVWMVVLTVVIVLVNGGTLWVLYRQLRELHDGGVDTHNLATAAQKQSAWTQQLAENMKTQADHTKDLAQEAVIQAYAAERSAVAAKLAADTAGDNLRPWIKIDQLSVAPSGPRGKMFSQEMKDGSTSYSFQLKAKITNVGHSPAREIEIVPLAFTAIALTPLNNDEGWREEERVCWADKERYGLLGTSFHEFMFPSESQEGDLEVPGIIKPGIGYPVPIYVMLCVRYKGVGTRKYHTVASRELWERGPDGSNFPVLVRLRPDASVLSLEPVEHLWALDLAD